jgi:succinate dehydrogenase flavin-adding protein (antitoxin of CptAB toxin-antitoxin module)
MEITTEYDKDFYAWLMKNAMLIRNKQFTEMIYKP